MNVEPRFKAWRVVNKSIEVGDVFKGYLIISIHDVTNTTYEEKFNKLNLPGDFKLDLNFSNLIENYNNNLSELCNYPVPEEEYAFELGKPDFEVNLPKIPASDH